MNGRSNLELVYIISEIVIKICEGAIAQVPYLDFWEQVERAVPEPIDHAQYLNPNNE